MDSDWRTIDNLVTAVNGFAVDPSEVGALLAGYSAGVVSVVLSGAHSTQAFELRFAVADPADLHGVDARLDEMVRQHQLTMNSIESFLAGTAHLPTAGDYRAGIAEYFYGVLARERSPESGLPYDAYRERYDQAVALLGGFDRAAANAICGLVAFHYNQFDRAILRTGCARIAGASRRLNQLLGGEPADVVTAIVPERERLDFVLSDAVTELVLSWCCTALDGSAGTTIDEIESSLRSQEPLDQFKLRLIAAEHHLRAGTPERGKRHADELRHNPTAETWAQRYLARTRTRREA